MGRVPSGCASFTSAPARIRSSAALWSPASIRLASAPLELCGRTGKATSISLALLLMLVALPVLPQSSKGALASLIEAGDHKAALERIRAGADVNEAQPDGTRPINWAVYRVDY